jgi:hypothetical protein
MNRYQAPCHSGSRDSALLSGLVLGLVQGVLMGILFARKPGVQFNRDVQQFINDLPNQLTEDNTPNALTPLRRAAIRMENGVLRIKRFFAADKQAAAKRREEQTLLG